MLPHNEVRHCEQSVNKHNLSGKRIVSQEAVLFFMPALFNMTVLSDSLQNNCHIIE